MPYILILVHDNLTNEIVYIIVLEERMGNDQNCCTKDPHAELLNQYAALRIHRDSTKLENTSPRSRFLLKPIDQNNIKRPDGLPGPPLNINAQNYIVFIEGEPPMYFKGNMSEESSNCQLYSPSDNLYFEGVLKHTERGLTPWCGLIHTPSFRGYIRYEMKHGRGTVIDEEGNQYNGEWNNDKAFGTMDVSYVSGDKYSGPLKDLKRHGFGTFYKVNGDSFRCHWEGDVIHGKGTSIENGVSYTGEWQYGLKTGRAIVQERDGIKYDTLWVNDVCVDSV